MKQILFTLSLFIFGLTLTGCSLNSEQITENIDSFTIDPNSFDLSNDLIMDSDYGSTGALNNDSFTITEMLIYAIEDEYAAKAEYIYIIDNFTVTNPFTNIISSEETHINLLLPLFETYSIEIPANTASNHIITIASLEEAFATGVVAEELNIAMYNLFLSQSDLPNDLIDVFTKLRDASINHLAAFQKNLDRY